MDGKFAADLAEHNKHSSVYEARWIYRTQEEALKWAERYRAEASEDSEWRIVPVKEIQTT
jgi:hypothetical protein